jgi:hypothetical protein
MLNPCEVGGPLTTGRHPCQPQVEQTCGRLCVNRFRTRAILDAAARRCRVSDPH